MHLAQADIFCPFRGKLASSLKYKLNISLVAILFICWFTARPVHCQNPSDIGNQDSIKEFAFKTLEDCMQRRRKILANSIGDQFRVNVPDVTDFYMYELSILSVPSIELDLPDDRTITLRNGMKEQILPPISLSPGESLMIPFRSRIPLRSQKLQVVLRSANTSCTRVSTSTTCGEDISALQYTRDSTSTVPNEVHSVLGFIQKIFKNCSEAPTIQFSDGDITAPVSSMVYLRCISSGFPPPRVQWYLVNDNVNQDRRIPVSSRNTGFAVASIEVTATARGTEKVIAGTCPSCPFYTCGGHFHDGNFKCSPSLEIEISELDIKPMLFTFKGETVASRSSTIPSRYLCQSENENGTAEKYATVATFDQECRMKYSNLMTSLSNALDGNCAYERTYPSVGSLSQNFSEAVGFLASVNIAEPFSFRSYFIISDVEVKLALERSDLSFFGLSPRSKRDLASLLYVGQYQRVVFNHSYTKLHFNPPVLYDSKSDFTQAGASVYYRNPALRQEGSSGVISAVLCAKNPASMCESIIRTTGNLLQDDCFKKLEAFIREDISTKFLAIQRCVNVSFGEPYLTDSFKPFFRKKEKSVFYVTCPIEGALSTKWFKATDNGFVLTTSRHTLSIKDFRPTDQGRYECRGYGSKSSVTSKAVYFILEGYTTYLVFLELDNNDIGEADIGAYVNDLFKKLTTLSSSERQAELSAVVPLHGYLKAKVHVALPRNPRLSRDQQIMQIIEDIRSEAERTDPTGVVRDVYARPLSYCTEDTVILFGSLNVTFPETVLGRKAASKQTCGSPPNEVPLATRECWGDFVSYTQWKKPIISPCPNYNKTDLPELIKNVADERFVGMFAEDIIENLAETVKNFNVTIDTLGDVAEVLEAVVREKRESIRITRGFVDVIDFVLDLPEEIFEESLQMDAPNRILQAFQTQVTIIQNLDSNFTAVRDNVGVFAVKVETSFRKTLGVVTNFTSEDFKDNSEPLSENNTAIFEDDSSVSDMKLRASISIPIDVIFKDKNLSTAPVSFFVFKTSLLFQSPVSNSSEHEVDGMVVSATVEGKNVTDLSFETPAVIKVYPTYGNESCYQRTAVYWNMGMNTSVWSSDGCVLQSRAGSNGALVHESHCTHLTNFGVLLNRHGNLDNAILDILSIAGCVISVVALAITVFTFLYHREFRKQRPKQILNNLCFSLMGLYLAFLIGIERKRCIPITGCVISGTVIHYFTLTSMAWMSVEATNMYLLFWKIFDTHVSRFMTKCILFAWGLPLLVVGLIVIIGKDIYVNDTYCFLQPNSWAFYLGLFLPVAVLLLYNFVVFCLVINRLMCQKAQGESLRDSKVQRSLLKRFQSTAAISSLLGLTWVFGFLSFRENRFIYNLLFCVFNTLQGLFIFLFFCLRQKDVRDFWWNLLTCGFKCWKDKSTMTSVTDFSKKTGKTIVEINDQRKEKSPQKTVRYAVTAEFNTGIPVLK